MKNPLSWVAGLATALALIGGSAAPAQAAPVPNPTTDAYVALGDSFASGWGAGAEPNALGQTEGAYPVLLAKGRANLTFLATGMGGTTATALAQVPTLPATAAQITLTVGGNDLGFVEKALACSEDPAACAPSPDDAVNLAELAQSLSALIAAIHDRAPAATIYVTGYPVLFQATGATCVIGTQTTSGGPAAVEAPKASTDLLDAAAVGLNETIKASIPPGSYAKYVDVSVPFLGHGLCGAGAVVSPDSWINAAVLPNGDLSPWALHPTAEGQAAYAAQVLAAGFSQGAPQGSGFADVPQGTQFFSEIRWLADQGISTGWPAPNGSSTFRPLSPVNRDAMAAFIYRLAGEPAFEAPTTPSFVDVAVGTQFYKEIEWMKAAGLATGWDDRTFRPWTPINRDAMAAFLYRLAGEPEFEAPQVSPFTDVATDSDYYTEITWLQASGITTGWGDDTFRPQQSVARDAMAAFLYRYVSTLGWPAP